MPRDPKIVEQMRDRQRRMFRIATDATRYGLTLKAIQLDSGLGYDSLCNYASGDTIMPITALVKLIGVIPNELLSLLLPEAQAIVTIPSGINHDELATAAHDYLSAKTAAHHPESEAGTAIGPVEHERLSGKAVRLAVSK